MENASHQHSDTSLARRVEEASLNAWPALSQTVFDGWLLRFARGFTKRANCVVPLYPGDGSLGLIQKVRYCENQFAKERLKTIFRLTTLQNNAPLDQCLEDRGYAHLDQSAVMTGPTRDGPVDVHLHPIDDWLAAYCELTGMPEPARSLHRLLLGAINSECAFATLAEHGQVRACALAVVDHKLVGLFDLVTHPDYRRQGYARRLVSSLMAWGHQRGARHAYLQVVAENQPAVALYRQLGFSELYQYWYRSST